MSNNRLDPKLDINGTMVHNDSLDVTRESEMLGEVLAGQTGSGASISGTAPNMVITGLTGMTDDSVNRFLTIEGADETGNNGNFLITQFINATSVVINNSLGIGGDVNNGSISWIERFVWSVEEDHNYHRSDRANIKGVAYDDLVPTYSVPSDLNNLIPANLANIAGNTTDAKAFIVDREYYGQSVSFGDSFITITDVGSLKHAGNVDITGVPISDGYDTDTIQTFVIILDGYGTEITVDAGPNIGWRIFGKTRKGSSTSPDSVEVEFFAIALGSELGTEIPYTWEASQPSTINLIIGYRDALASLNDVDFRRLRINGILFGGDNTTNLPLPTEYGQFLFAQDATEFIAAVPVVNDEGLIMVDENGKVVVVGV